MNKYKLNYKKIGKDFVNALDFAMTCISKIFMIHICIVGFWYACIGFVYMNGTISEPIPKIDYNWLMNMYFLYILGWVSRCFIKQIINEFRSSKDVGTKIEGTGKFVDYSEYERLIGKYFHYDGYTYQVINYKRIITMLNENQCSVDNVFEVGKFQENGTIYPTLWTKDELYMALAEDESSR